MLPATRSLSNRDRRSPAMRVDRRGRPPRITLDPWRGLRLIRHRCPAHQDVDRLHRLPAGAQRPRRRSPGVSRPYGGFSREPLKLAGTPGVIHRAERKRDERSRSGRLCGDPAADGGDAQHRLWNRGGEQRSFLRRHAVCVLESSHLGLDRDHRRDHPAHGRVLAVQRRGDGRFIGIFAATLGAIESLFAIGGPHPWWALGIFVVSLWVLHGLIVFSEDFEVQT